MRGASRRVALQRRADEWIGLVCAAVTCPWTQVQPWKEGWTMTRMKRLASTVGFVAAAALGGCVAYAGPAGVTYVSSEPPVARAEVITTSPGVGFVWVNGHWGWDGSYYRWVSGGWTRPAVGY